jgi:hypothetical protein
MRTPCCMFVCVWSYPYQLWFGGTSLYYNGVLVCPEQHFGAHACHLISYSCSVMHLAQILLVNRVVPSV